MIPEIIDMPEIKVDPAALILFYGILYHGSLTVSQDGKLTQAIYVHCLRAIPTWQKQATGTKLDLMTAILLVCTIRVTMIHYLILQQLTLKHQMRAAFQQCDLEFSWRMYDLVCQFVKKLNMHTIDQSFPNSFPDLDTPTGGADQHRKSFWSLVLVDFFFQLLHGKPAIITSNTTDWRVNLPSMDTIPNDSQHAAATLTFLVKFRLTLIFLHFFDTMGKNAEGKAGVIKHIKALYDEIEALFREWSVVSSAASRGSSSMYVLPANDLISLIEL